MATGFEKQNVTFVRQHCVPKELLVCVKVATQGVEKDWQVLHSLQHRLVHLLVIDREAADRISNAAPHCQVKDK